jgi:hypothetical protein
MHAKKWWMLVINIVGGTAVLGSYALSVQAHPNAVDLLWGGVPQALRPFYTACMFIAAAGYFAFTYYILFRLDPPVTQLFGHFGFGLFNSLYAAILIPSSLWMPLTFLALERSSQVLLWAVRLDLALVALASVGLLIALLNVQPRRPAWAIRLAIAGAIGFCIQTVLLDSIIWSAFFHL